MQVNYLADCSLEIFDDPSAIALIEVLCISQFHLFIRICAFHFCPDSVFYPCGCYGYLLHNILAIICKGTVRQKDVIKDLSKGERKDIKRIKISMLCLLHYLNAMITLFRSVCCIHNGIHHSFVLFLGVFRDALLGGKICTCSQPGFRKT